MLPWENIPSLRYAEVYRMPSFSGIQFTHSSSSRGMDPLNAFYLLNPDGDLPTAETNYMQQLEHVNLEGMAGLIPRDADLASKLKSRDVFYYAGHGSGDDHIPEQEIEKIDSCPAAILMGCSSGSLTLEGSYAPRGVAQSYLLAGSPTVIATLWNVTGDIDRFGTHLYTEMLKDRSLGSNSRNIAELMGQSRDSCEFPFLTGASTVCYGVPTTFIERKQVGK